jgi:hypothetical protein
MAAIVTDAQSLLWTFTEVTGAFTVSLKFRIDADQTDVNDDNFLTIWNNAGSSEAVRLYLSLNNGATDSHFLDCTVFHSTSNRSRQNSALIITEDVWHTFTVTVGDSLLNTDIHIYLDGSEISYTGGTAVAVGTMRARGQVKCGERFANNGFAARYAEVLLTAAVMGATNLALYAAGTTNPVRYGETIVLYRELRSDATIGQGVATYTADGATFDSAVHPTMAAMPVTLADQLLIRQPDLWPSAQATPLAIGGGRNTNNNADPHEEKFAIFCSRIVSGEVYHYAELLNGPDTHTYLAKQTSHNAILAFTGTFSPLLAEGDFTGESDELAITSVMANPWGAGLIAFLHGGNNGTATRRIYYATSNDASGIGALGTWTAGNGGNPIITSVESYETNRVADFHGIYDPIANVINGFYRGTNGSDVSRVVRCTVNSSFAVTKIGTVSTDGWVPGQIHESAAGVYQMYWSPSGATAGPRHAVSYDYGVTWTMSTTEAATPQGGTTVPDAIGIADHLSLWYDARYPETISVMAGCEVSSGSITDVPYRGRCMFHTAYPKALTDIVRHGRFYGRDNAAGRAQSTFSPSTSVMNSSAWMVPIEFRARRNDRTQYRELFTAFGAFNVAMYVRIEGGGSTNGGKIGFYFRTPTATMSVMSTNRFDDGEVHRIVAIRNSAGSWELWVDNTEEVTSATNPTTDATSSTHCLGNWASATGEPSEPGLCSVRAAYLTGTPPTSNEYQAGIDALNGTAYSGGTFQYKSWSDTTTDTSAVANVEMEAATSASGSGGIGGRGRARMRCR